MKTILVDGVDGIIIEAKDGYQIFDKMYDSDKKDLKSLKEFLEKNI